MKCTTNINQRKCCGQIMLVTGNTSRRPCEVPRRTELFHRVEWAQSATSRPQASLSTQRVTGPDVRCRVVLELCARLCLFLVSFSVYLPPSYLVSPLSPAENYIANNSFESDFILRTSRGQCVAPYSSHCRTPYGWISMHYVCSI